MNTTSVFGQNTSSIKDTTRLSVKELNAKEDVHDHHLRDPRVKTHGATPQSN